MSTHEGGERNWDHQRKLASKQGIKPNDIETIIQSSMKSN